MIAAALHGHGQLVRAAERRHEQRHEQRQQRLGALKEVAGLKIGAARFAGVDESLFERSPLELSGGQKRRIAIAGVIAMRPKVLILDEPTAGLDPAGCRGVLENIAAYRRETGSAVLLVTHSMDDAARIADRLIVFHAGHVAFDGAPAEVFAHTQELLDIGLDVPQAARIAQALRDRGVALPPSIYTLEQLTDALLAVGKEAGVC